MSDLLDKFYMSSPVWMQQVLVSGYGLWWYFRRFGPAFHRLVSEFEERQNWSLEQFTTYQEQLLSIILNKAWSSPHYKKVFNKAGINRHMPAFEALGRIPLLPKETLRTSATSLLTEISPPKGTIVIKSSGTTGTPTSIYYSRELHQMSMAWFEARARRWAGLNYRDRRVMFGVRKVCNFNESKPPFWRINPAENMAYMSVYHMSSKYLPSYLAFLRKYRPDIIMGYPNSIYTLARFALEHEDMPAPARAVITTSEKVTDKIRQTIESVWKCKLFDTYGAVEACMFASQCEHGRYHVSPEVGIIEILDPQGNKCPPGIAGEVVCTGLQNVLQPLIRYQIGDLASWSYERECPCGRHMPIIQSIDGRVEDMCYTPDGRALLRFDTVFKGVEAIREGQIIQSKLEEFIIKVVPDDNFGKNEEDLLKKNMRLHVGDVQVKIETVANIARTTSDKFRAVICQLENEAEKSVPPA